MRMTRALMLTIAAAVLVAPWSAEIAAQSDAAGVQEIKNVTETYRKASLAGDLKAIMALYADDAIESPPFQPALKGRAAIEAYYRKEMAEAKLTAMTFTHIDTQASGNIGYDVGSVSQTVEPAGGKPVSSNGYYTVILKKMGGAWKVTSAIYHTDAPPPAEPMKKP